MTRRGRIALGAALTTVLMVVCCCGVTVSYFLGGLGSKPNQTMSPASCGGTTVDSNAALPSINSLGRDQIRNAAVIVSVGQQMKVPPRGWVIAIATALQESALVNLGNLGAHNDHDSLGLFQQRPSQGWGTPQQVMDPVYASQKFYQRLLAVHGWESMALTDAAQTVQRSAFPNAYAKHEPLASVVVNTLTGGAARAVGAVVKLQCNTSGKIAASGWTNPVPGSTLTSTFRSPQRPTHNGDDLAASKGTKIVAASAGVVTVVRCQATTASGAFYGCDQDGSMSVMGCGWYVEILHANSVVTRYCHQLRPPMVHVGQQVAAGEQIGWVGDTGNSSGPHCHFEVHINGDTSASGAIDPVPFMNQQGAPLGRAP
jgi:murein DD-endopeptidase MepM/ murein hydrolase activator NlpD